jgi:hypothetical protein
MALIDNWLHRPEKPGGIRVAGLWLLAMSCLLTCAGVIYLLIGFNTWLAAAYGTVIAPLATAGLAFVLAGGAALGFRRAERRPPQPTAHEASMMETAEALFSALEHATEGLEEPIAANPRTSVALASLAGYMAADKLH